MENLTRRKDLVAYFKKLEEVQKEWQGSFPLPPWALGLRCGYWWKKRTSNPKKCPRCLSKHWATQRKNRQGLRPEVK